MGDVSADVARVTGTEPPVSDTRRAVASDDRRFAELRDVAARLEDGGALVVLDRALTGPSGLRLRLVGALDGG